MLGNDVLSVRLGGIYALRSLAEEHPEQYHIQAMRLLCAFVRNPTDQGTVSIEVQQTTVGPVSHGAPILREDVQAAIDAICACHEINVVIGSSTQFCLDFRDTDLSGARFERVDLSVNLPSRVRTSAESVNSHPVGADFARAQLRSANMLDAKLPRANFFRANLSSASLGLVDMSDANLSGANLYDADLPGAILSGATPQGADLSYARLEGADLSRAWLGIRSCLAQGYGTRTYPAHAYSVCEV